MAGARCDIRALPPSSNLRPYSPSCLEDPILRHSQRGSLPEPETTLPSATSDQFPLTITFGSPVFDNLRSRRPGFRHTGFSETGLPVYGVLGNPTDGPPWLLLNLPKSGYCNKRTMIRTSKTMSRVAIRTLPIRNALRRSYLNPLFLLRPTVLLPAPSP
jgi:hypothetical protein